MVKFTLSFVPAVCGFLAISGSLFPRGAGKRRTNDEPGIDCGDSSSLLSWRRDRSKTSQKAALIGRYIFLRAGRPRVKESC